MDVATLWIKRKGNEDGPAELIVAWDGWSIEENWEGWRDACDREITLIGDDIASMRFINLKVSENAVEDAFREWRSIPAILLTELEDPRTL